jgi:hypothetical protein
MLVGMRPCAFFVRFNCDNYKAGFALKTPGNSEGILVMFSSNAGGPTYVTAGLFHAVDSKMSTHCVDIVVTQSNLLR